MLKTISDQNDGTFRIHVAYEASELKDGETLTGDTLIRGTEAQANDYASVFAADLRRCNPEKFPEPEMLDMPMMDEGVSE